MKIQCGKMKNMKKLVIANWKLHPASLAEAVKLARKSDKKGAVICPPFPFIPAVSRVLKHASLGAQDIFWEEKGAYTGQVSAVILKQFHTRYVIIGHSERRSYAHETDEMINRKVQAAQAAGLHPILCVGEPLNVRRRGIAAAKRFVAAQLKKDLAETHGRIVIAYEPIWAIGTGKPDKPEESAEMIVFIKKTARKISPRAQITCLYGGSVKPENARSFLSRKEIDGALVGGASLSGKSFGAILQKVQ